jgi:hypothetical protein
MRDGQHDEGDEEGHGEFKRSLDKIRVSTARRDDGVLAIVTSENVILEMFGRQLGDVLVNVLTPQVLLQ